MADRKWFARPPARGRLGAARRPHLGAGRTLGLWGPRARDILASRDLATTSRTRASRSRTCRTIEVGPLRVLASRISYVGDLGWELYVPIEQGARLWDMRLGGRRSRTASCPPGSASTARPGGSRSATARSASSSTPSTTSSRPAWPGARSRTQDFVGKEAHLAPARGGAGGGPLHAHRRRPHVGDRREALHARPRADPDRATASRSTDAQGPPLVRDERRAPGRRSASTSCMAYLPPEHANVGEQLAVEYMGERYPGHGRRRRLDADLRPRERADPAREDPRLRQARADDRRARSCSPTTSRRSRRATSASRSARTRSAASRRRCGSSRRTAARSVVLTLGPPEAEEQLRDVHGDRRRPRRSMLVTDGEEWDAQATAAAIVEAVRADGSGVRPDRVRQRVGRRRRLPGRHPGRLRARAARA